MIETVSIANATVTSEIKAEEKNVSYYMQNVPSIVCTALIIIADKIYSKIARKIADNENHRD